ncbi:MAG: Hsp33 family molecular chaperone HslO [Acetobacteraceae bacterium]
MQETPVFLDLNRPPVPDIVVPRGITPFFLPNRPVRGRLIRLGPLADALLTRHPANPEPVTQLAGEALALAAGLASALKFRGSFSLQAKGDGPVPMLLADCTDTGALRGYARVDAARFAATLAENPNPTGDRLLGTGYLAFTVDQGPEQRHQGMVSIEGESLADMALHYFTTSEQLRCHLHLACARTKAGWRAGALVLERIAGAGGVDPEMPEEAREESWRTATALASTLTDAELLDDTLPPERLLNLLFTLEGVSVDRARALSYGCRCSRARLAGILEGFPEDDLDHMAVGGDIVMTCEFCNYDFRFPRADVQSRLPNGDGAAH